MEQEPNTLESTEKQLLTEKISNANHETYKKLLTEISQVTDPIIRESHVAALAKKINVPKQLLMDALKNVVREVNGDFKASFPELIDLVLTDNRQVAYLVLKEGIPTVVDGWKTQDGQSFVPPEQKYIPFQLGRASKVLEHFRHDNDHLLAEDTLKYLKRFSYLPDREWVVIAMSIFLSYLQSHPEVRYVPVIYFYAVAERGKSRTAKSMLSIMYRGIHLVDLKPANIFRYAQNFNATTFFDCTEVWKTAEKSDCTDILLGRFEKGTQITRVLFPDAGAFKDQVSFSIFGSTIVATNEPANITFESRCLTISMPNRPGEYENPTPELGVDLKERMIAFRARNMTRALPQVAAIPGISGRLWDISRPLFQLSQLLYPEGFEPMKDLLLEMVGKKIEVKKGSLEGKIVAAITEVANFEGVPEDTFRFDEITSRINAGMPERKKYSPQRLGRVVESLSIKTKTIHGYSQVTISQVELEKLKVQYGLTVEEIHTPELESSGEQAEPICVPVRKKVQWGQHELVIPVATEAHGVIRRDEPVVESGSVVQTPHAAGEVVSDGQAAPTPKRISWSQPDR